MAWSNSTNSLPHTAQALLLGSIAAIGLAILGTNIYSDWSNTNGYDHKPQTSNTVPVRAEPISIHSLIDAQLFGQVRLADKKTATAPIQAPETRLKLELKGAFSHTDMEQSRALVAEKGKNAKYYRVGDLLPGGAALDQVAAEHVVLNRSGVLETLSFNPNKHSQNTRSGQPSQLSSVEPSAREAASSADLVSHSGNASRIEPAMHGQSNMESIKERLKRLRAAREL